MVARQVALAVVWFGALPAPAQQAAAPAPMIMRPVACGDMARFDPAELADGAVAAPSRMVSVLVRWRPDETEPALNLAIGRSAAGVRLVVRGTSGQADRVGDVITLLQRAELPHARLQLSLLTMPRDVATAHGLIANVAVPLDEAKSTTLARETVRRGGTLHNAPERLAAPLAPFVVTSPGGKTGAAERRGVRVEMVPAADDTVLLGLHFDVAEREPPRVLPSGSAADAPVVPVKAGQLVAVPWMRGDSATVLVVRCCEITSRQLGGPR